MAFFECVFCVAFLVQGAGELFVVDAGHLQHWLQFGKGRGAAVGDDQQEVNVIFIPFAGACGVAEPVNLCGCNGPDQELQEGLKRVCSCRGYFL